MPSPLILARLYNRSDIEVIMKIVGIGEDEVIRRFVDIGSKSDIFQLAVGERIFIAWDAFTNKIIAPVRREVIKPPLGIRITLTGKQGAYDWTLAEVPQGENL